MADTNGNLTWADEVRPFIMGELPHDVDKGAFNDVVLVQRLNIGIGIINERTGGFEGSWRNDQDNAYGTSLSLSGATCTFPRDLQEATTVRWADVELPYRTEAELNRIDPTWRSATGTPSFHTTWARGIILDCNPNNDTGGPLEIQGMGNIPRLALDPGSLNPFAYLPENHQMSPAFYVLGNLPLHGRTKEDVVAIQADYRRQWDEFLESLEWGVIERKYPALKD